MEVNLTYGRGQVVLEIPERNFGGLVKTTVKEGEDPAASFARSLNHPTGKRIEDLCRGRRVVVLIEDDTRAEPHEQIISALSPRLRESAEVNFIVTAGSHDIKTEGNRAIMEKIRTSAEEDGLELGGVHINDCFADNFRSMGKTRRGTPLEINPVALEAEIYVVAADMKNHYFAGYSNALKDFLPGICGYSSIEANHSMALDPRSTFGVHPLHPDPKRRDNPLADDMLEAERMITRGRPVFSLSMVSSHGEVIWSGAGSLDKTIAEGIGVVDRVASFTVDRTRYAVVSPGGYPQDDSLYNSQRALELTKNCIADGGQVLLLSECENGIAPNLKARENFYDRLTQPIPEILRSIESEYQLYSHKAYKFARLIERLESIQLHSALDEAVLTDAHLGKTEDPQSTIDAWIEADPGAKIKFFDDGNKIAVYSR